MVIRRVTAWFRWWREPRADTPLDVLLDPGFVAIDLETTGLDSRRDSIVSMAAIPFVGGRPQQGHVTLVNPGRPIPMASTRIHGIDDAAVVAAPALDDVLPAFDAVCAGAVVAGHDIPFDLAVLRRVRRSRAYAEPHALALDTRRLAVALHPSWRRVAELESVAERLGIPVVGRHTADGDARLAGHVLVTLLPQFRARGVRTLRDLVRAQKLAYRHT
jgi:DNA polymerase III epsilon subunit-like protein